MGTPPTTLGPGCWISPTERIIAIKFFKYGARATVYDQSSGTEHHVKSKDEPAGLKVVGVGNESLAEPVTLPWPTDHPPIEELEAELAKGQPLVDVLAPEADASAPAEVPASEQPPIEAEVPALQPPPGPSGYQPAVGEGVSEITVSTGPDGTTLSATLRFPQPRVWAEAQPAVDDLVEAVERFVRPSAQPEPQAEASSASTDPAIGSKPTGETFYYRPTSAVTTEQLTAGALAGVPDLPSGQLVVYDNRIGDYGLEAGSPAWCIGVIKADPEGWLAGTDVPFEGDDVPAGSKALATIGLDVDTMRHEVKLTKFGRAVVASL